MKIRLRYFSLLLPLVLIATPLYAATPKAGGTCTKAGTTSTYSGKKYKCVKSGKKLIWNKGATLSVPKSFVTPTPSSTQQDSQQSSTTNVYWRQGPGAWVPVGSPPPCPNPLTLALPADITKVTSILYPGQARPTYKPHGGFRFDNNADNRIDVSAPLSAVVIRGARSPENGEVQYAFDFMHPCGIMYRLGHLLKLTQKFQQIADKFPMGEEGDSRTTNVDPQVAVTAGEKIATEVGFTKPGLNVFFDWGVYDMRTKNKASQDSAWATRHADDVQLAPYAVCWFDLLKITDAAAVRSLPPGDQNAGRTSDYCR